MVSGVQGGLIMFATFVFLATLFLVVMNNDEYDNGQLKNGLCFFYFLLGCYPMLQAKIISKSKNQM